MDQVVQRDTGGDSHVDRGFYAVHRDMRHLVGYLEDLRVDPGDLVAQYQRQPGPFLNQLMKVK